MSTIGINYATFGPMLYDDISHPYGVDMYDIATGNPSGVSRMGNILLNDLTASRIVATDASKKMSSISLNNWLSGTNDITISALAGGKATIGRTIARASLRMDPLGGYTVSISSQMTNDSNEVNMVAIQFDSAGAANNITVGASLDTLTPADSGYYQMIATLSIKAQTAGDTALLSYFENSGMQQHSTIKHYFPDNTNYYTVSIVLQEQVNSGIPIDLRIGNRTGTGNFTIGYGHLAMIKV